MDHDVKGVVERTEQSLFTHFRHQLNTHWLAALEQQNTHIAGFVHPVPEAQSSSSTPKIKVQKLCDPFVVEVRTLKGHLGEVVLGQGKVTFWDLAKEIHSQFPLPERCFSRLVVGDACNPRSLETQADKVMTITDHHVTIVYEELTPDLQREAERSSRGRSASMPRVPPLQSPPLQSPPLRWPRVSQHRCVQSSVGALYL